MKALQWTAYFCFFLSGTSVLAAMTNEAPAFLAVAVGLVITGICFLAVDRALWLLTDIRNALVPQVAPAAAAEQPSVLPGVEVAATRARTAAEIAADIAAMKARS